MPNNGFSIDQAAIEEKLILIETDIKEISDIFNKIYKKMVSLDRGKWIGAEKDKIDEQYMPYLGRLNDLTETFLMNYVTMIRESVMKHVEADAMNKSIASDLTEL